MALGAGRVIDFAILPFWQNQWIDKIMVVHPEGDKRWNENRWAHSERLCGTPGGEQRHQSVLNGLHALSAWAKDQDWVWVHDGARPCLHPDDIAALRLGLEDESAGALLGTPVTDTIKRLNTSNSRVENTVDRQDLWSAMTPQVFRFSALYHALCDCEQQRLTPTDECGAMEKAGWNPRLIQGRRDNIKVTRPEDLLLARLILQSQHRMDLI